MVELMILLKNISGKVFHKIFCFDQTTIFLPIKNGIFNKLMFPNNVWLEKHFELNVYVRIIIL